MRIFNPGKHPFAEFYTVNYPISQVKDSLKQFNKENYESSSTLPEYQIYCENAKQLDYFYFLNRGRVFLTCITPSGLNKTKIIFIGVGSNIQENDFKNINDEFGFFENRKLKMEFERNVFNKIEQILAKSHEKQSTN